MESLVSCRSPSWHSRLLPPAQLIQEGFFSSITMYCNSCCRKRQKNPSRDTKTESLRSPGPAQGQAHTPQFLIQPSSAPMGVPIQPAAPETLARQEVNSMFHCCTRCIWKQEGSCPVLPLWEGIAGAGGIPLLPGSLCSAQVSLHLPLGKGHKVRKRQILAKQEGTAQDSLGSGSRLLAAAGKLRLN